MIPNDVFRCVATNCPSAAKCARTEPIDRLVTTGNFTHQIPEGADKCGAFIPKGATHD